MNFFDASFWQSFVSNGLATLLGVVIGIPVALWVNGLLERRAEKEHKIKILKSLYDELKINNDFIVRYTKKIFPNDLEISMGFLDLYSNLREEAWRAFSDGGELQWIKDSDLLFTLANAYSFIRSIKLLSEKYFDVGAFSTFTGVSSSYKPDVQNRQRQILMDKIDESMSTLRDTLPILGKLVDENK